MHLSASLLFLGDVVFQQRDVFSVISPGCCPSAVYARLYHRSPWNKEALEARYPLFNPFFPLIYVSLSAVTAAVVF